MKSFFGPQSVLPLSSLAPGGTFLEKFMALANLILSNILSVIGVVAVFFVILAGLKYITAGGNAAKAKEARDGLIHVVIGILVVAGSFTIVKLATSLADRLTQ